MWRFKTITQCGAALGEGNGKNGKSDMLGLCTRDLFSRSSIPLVIKTILSDRLMAGWLSSLMLSSASLAC